MLSRLLRAYAPALERILSGAPTNVLDAAFAAMKTQRGAPQANALLALMQSQDYAAADLSFLCYDILNVLSSDDVAVRTVGFRAASFYLSEHAPFIDMMPSVVQASLQSPLLVAPALNALSRFVSPFVFGVLQESIFALAGAGSDIVRKLAICTIFKAYRANGAILERFLELLKGGIFQPETKLLALGILCEIAQEHPDAVQRLSSIFIAEVPLSTPICFSKLSRLFIALLRIDRSIQADLEKAIPHFVSRHTELETLIDVSDLLSHFEGNCPIYARIGAEINRVLAADEDPNHQYVCLNAISRFASKCKIDTSAVSGVSRSGNPILIGKSLQIKYQILPEKMSVLNEILANINETKSIDSALCVLKLIPRKGEKFINVLFQLYELGIRGLVPYLSKTIMEINDEETRQLLCKIIVDTLIDTPDDEFGFSLASAVSNWSKRPTDIEVLLPPTLSKKTYESQSILVECAFFLFFRLHFLLPKGLVNRLELLTQSPSHEVRQRASEFLFILEQISLVSHSK